MTRRDSEPTPEVAAETTAETTVDTTPGPLVPPGDWAALVRAGRFTQARTLVRAARMDATRTEGAHTDTVRAASTAPDASDLAAVETLAEIQELTREKSWARAIGRIERLAGASVPVDANALERELRVLRDASALLDRRDAAGALTELDGLTQPYLEAEVATQRGTARILLDEPTAARVDFESALEIDPRHYRAMTNLGNLELEQGDADAAIAAYRDALRINDDFANAHHNLGVALRRKGNVAQSVRSLRRAQKAMQQQDAERAKASVPNVRSVRWLRWLLVAGAALALYWILQQRGVL